MAKKNIENLMDDYSLERVPLDKRRPWKEIAAIQMGQGTALAVLLTGGLATFYAGFWMGMLAALIAFIVSTSFIYLMGTISYREGLSSNIISRAYAFGTRGSALASIIWGFMIIGFLGLENVLIGNTLLFYLGIESTTTIKLILYVILSIFWITLSLFGAHIVARVAQISIPLLFIGLVYMVFILRDGPFSEVFSFGIMVPGIDMKTGFSFAINATVTLAGLLAITATDFTRFIGSRKDVMKVSVTSSFAMYGVTMIFGAIITYFGYKLTQSFYTDQGMATADAFGMAITNPGITLVLAGGVLGVIVVILSQSKCQVGNSYEGALALVNLFDSLFKWKPGRAVMVVLANILSLIFIFGNILTYIQQFLTLGSVLLCVWVTIVISDYYIVRGMMKRGVQGITSLEEIPAFNFRGIATLFISSGLGMALNSIFPVPFVISVITAFVLYTGLSYFIVEREAAIHTGMEEVKS